MSVGTTVNWVNQVTQTTTTSTTDENAPLFLTCSAFPKGPTGLKLVDASNFNKLYGDSFSFKKYGQPAIQANRIIQSGGRLLVSRLVADDATYANLQFIAAVKEESVVKTKNGKKVYRVVETGVELTEDELEEDHKSDGTYEEVTYKVANVTYKVATSSDLTDPSKIPTEKTYNSDGTTYYRLFSVIDNGPGEDTGKRIRFSLSTTDSRSVGFAIYAIEEIENSSVIEKKKFTLNPDAIYDSNPLGMDHIEATQLNFNFNDEGFDAFLDKLVEITGYEKDYLLAQDLLFGNTYKGVALDQISITDDSVDFDYDYGIELKSGSDGTDFTFGSDAYNAKTLAFFSGEITDDIYNVDVYHIDVVADANYDIKTKEAIVELAEFRKDFFYFRDMGLEITSFDSVVEYLASLSSSKFAGTYLTAYSVKDPSTLKAIDVTIMYSMVDNIINHFNSGRYLAFAGFSISDMIDGTVKFIPKVTPKVNQKQLLEEYRVNYGSYVSTDSFIVETMNTSTDTDGQLNYIQNVLAVQHVIKDIRTYCPKNRYTFNYTPDFTDYAEDIQEKVIENHMTKFESLKFEYSADEDQIVEGTFEASISFSFYAHIQSEIFNIYAKD